MLAYTKDLKVFRSKDFNYNFDMKTGFTQLWGRTADEDPEVAPFPVIADIEITEVCAGPGGVICPFCYKSNVPHKGSVMSLELAKNVIDKLPKELTQIAFGVDAQCESNPEWYEIFAYARRSGFIPNVTVADITEETAVKLANMVGACAVSRYADKNWCYDSIEKLTRNGLKQVNIHILLSAETLPWVYETIEDAKTDPRLAGLNAIVFLSLKQKGRGVHFNRVSQEQYKEVVDKCLEKEISFGFDSCGCHRFLEAVKDHTRFKEFSMMAEPCESTAQSVYANARGEVFPCSFTEGTPGWEDGLFIPDFKTFDEIWNHERIKNFRTNLLLNKRRCPIYDV